ncbi:MAG: acyltransferase family protein [Deltaproteobacteria bacterium]
MGKRLDYIDAIRGLAIFGVIVVHTSHEIYDLPKYLLKIATEGARGVQLFFIASALTLFMTMIKRQEKEKHLIINFFIRRFFRIAPLFYIAIIFYILKDGLGPRYWLGDAPGISAWNIIATIFFINGWNPYWINSIVPGGWSIAVEMTFYLLVPLIFFKIKNISKAIWLFIFSIFLSFSLNRILENVHFISDQRLWSEYLFFWFPSQFPVFCLGIVLYFLIFSTSNLIKDSNKIQIATLLLGSSFCMILALLKGVSVPCVDNHVLYGIAFVIFALSLSIYQFEIFVNSFWIYLGKISFSSYLSHFALIPIATSIISYTCLEATAKYLLLLLITLILTITVSSITYYYVEKPCIKLGSILIKKIETSNYTIWLKKKKNTIYSSFKDIERER